jgi:hypothetical protein
MFAATGTKPAFAQRIKLLAAAGFLALAMIAGSGAATHVGAAAPQSGQVNAQTATDGTAINTTFGVVEKPKGSKANRGKTTTTAQPEVKCVWFSQDDATNLLGEKNIGPGGYWDCYVVQTGQS